MKTQLLQKRKKLWIVGIDEVGRGALAGPVTVAVVAATPYARKKLLKNEKKLPLRDSKKLSQTQRNEWYRKVVLATRQKNSGIAYAVASMPAPLIDKINVTQAANRAATKAFQRLVKRRGASIKKSHIFLDGGLHLSKSAVDHLVFPLLCTTVVHGDQKIQEIMLASIVAKVTRDRFMSRLSSITKQYSFSRHKGYGTRKHLRAILRYGPTTLHRKTFIDHL